MGWPKGVSKPKPEGSGRKKGTANKDSLPIEQKAKEMGIDPFEVLLRFTAGDWKGLGYENECYFVEKPDGATKMGYTITPEMRLKAASEACQYLIPKKKAVELSANSDSGVFKMVIEDYTSKK